MKFAISKSVAYLCINLPNIINLKIFCVITMKNLKFICLFFASVIVCNLTAFPQKRGDSITPIVIEKGVRNPTKPHTPSADESGIECYYWNETLAFNFTFPEGDCKTTVSNLTTGFVTSYIFDSDEKFVTITVGPLTEAQIIIETSSGSYYIGYLNK